MKRLFIIAAMAAMFCMVACAPQTEVSGPKVEQNADGIMLHEQPTQSAKQGDYISLKTVQEVRRGDKVYKEVAR